MDFLTRPEVLWFILGLVMLLLELVIPGFVIFFFGFGAWMASIACLIFDPGINLQIIIFAVSSITALVALRRTIRKKFLEPDDRPSDAVEDEFTGKEAMALIDFLPGKKGKVEFRGTSWTAISDEKITEGQFVTIIGKESINLIVKPK